MTRNTSGTEYPPIGTAWSVVFATKARALAKKTKPNCSSLGYRYPEAHGWRAFDRVRLGGGKGVNRTVGGHDLV